MMDIRRRRKFVRRFVSDGGSGRRMICGRRNMNMKAFLVVEEMWRQLSETMLETTTHQNVTAVSRAEASAVEGFAVASSVEGFSFSSTPWPLHRGQEFRPLVSHYNTIISKGLNIVLMRTYLVYTLLVEEMVAFDQASCVLIMFKVTETYETTLLRGQGNSVLAFKGNSNKWALGTLDLEDARSISNILLTGYRRLSRTQEGRQKHHVFIGGRIGIETRGRNDGVIFGIAATKDIDDPTTGILARGVVRFDKAVTSRRITTVAIIWLAESTWPMWARSQWGILCRGFKGCGCSGGPDDALTTVRVIWVWTARRRTLRRDSRVGRANAW
jgi:hypothetical protein